MTNFIWFSMLFNKILMKGKIFLGAQLDDFFEIQKFIWGEAVLGRGPKKIENGIIFQLIYYLFT